MKCTKFELVANPLHKPFNLVLTYAWRNTIIILHIAYEMSSKYFYGHFRLEFGTTKVEKFTFQNEQPEMNLGFSLKSTTRTSGQAARACGFDCSNCVIKFPHHQSFVFSSLLPNWLAPVVKIQPLLVCVDGIQSLPNILMVMCLSSARDYFCQYIAQ